MPRGILTSVYEESFEWISEGWNTLGLSPGQLLRYAEKLLGWPTDVAGTFEDGSLRSTNVETGEVLVVLK